MKTLITILTLMSAHLFAQIENPSYPISQPSKSTVRVNAKKIKVLDQTTVIFEEPEIFYNRHFRQISSPELVVHSPYYEQSKLRVCETLLESIGHSFEKVIYALVRDEDECNSFDRKNVYYSVGGKLKLDLRSSAQCTKIVKSIVCDVAEVTEPTKPKLLTYDRKVWSYGSTFTLTNPKINFNGEFLNVSMTLAGGSDYLCEFVAKELGVPFTQIESQFEGTHTLRTYEDVVFLDHKKTLQRGKNDGYYFETLTCKPTFRM